MNLEMDAHRGGFPVLPKFHVWIGCFGFECDFRLPFLICSVRKVRGRVGRLCFSSFIALGFAVFRVL